MIIQELRAEFNEYFQSYDAELILWLDPFRQWSGVIEHLKKDFRLIEYKGSQLEVKAEVELTWANGEKPKFVLYLPGLSRDRLSVLKEYEFSGKVFDETILQSFRRWGIEFEKEDELELGKILPIAIHYYAVKNIGFWKENNIPSKLRAKICDDEIVRQMLANPGSTTRQLKETERYEIFCDYVEDEFGGPNPRVLDPATWARDFTVYLLLTEVRAGTGHPSSFPCFDIPWADDRHEERCLIFIRDWLRNETYKEEFKRISGEVEKRYNLSYWASGLPDYPSCESSLSVEISLENRTLLKVNNLKGLDDLKNFLSVESSGIEQMAGHFWSLEWEIVIWRALNEAGKIIKGIDSCFAETGRLNTLNAFVQKYSGEWWKIDRDYRVYRYHYDGEDKLSKLSQYVASIYLEFQRGLNERFLSIVEREGKIAIEGIEEQGTFWSGYISTSKRKRAVFLVDALRFELARDLKDRLIEVLRDAKVKCTPVVSSIPTLTSVGMASIVAGEGIKINLSTEGEWVVTGSKHGQVTNISIKEERKKVLKKRHPKIAFYELADILKPSEINPGEGNPIVVFTREMDGLGHDSGVLNLSLDYLGQYLEGLVRAIRRLSFMGVEEVHIISDHGFIFLDNLSETDMITIPKDLEVLYKGHRCLVGKYFPAELGTILEIPDSDGLKLCVPRGIGLFRTKGGNQFFHGGISLQELIVPHIEIIFAKALPKYGVKLKAPEKIYNLIFKVELLRAIPADGLLFGAPRFVEIVGILVKDNEQIIYQSGPDMVINQEKESLSVSLRIKHGTSFTYADILRLNLKDADTGELLDSPEICIEVESNE